MTSSAKYPHTEKIKQRRKALFPTSDSPEDLNPLISSDSSFSDIQALEDLEAEFGHESAQHFFKNNLTDYIILNKNSEGEIKENVSLFSPDKESFGLNGKERNGLFNLCENKENSIDLNKTNVSGFKIFNESKEKCEIFNSNNVEKCDLLHSNKLEANSTINNYEVNRLIERNVINLGKSEGNLNSLTPSTRIANSDAQMSPLYLSPMHTLITSPILYSPRITRPLTPSGRSPTSSLKTPNDTTVKVNAKNQKRKMETTAAESECGKTSPAAKNLKLDPMSLNKSKVRTALFTDGIPASSFYPKTVERPKRRLYPVVASPVKKTAPRKPAPVYLCARAKNKRSYGMINRGVMHKLKKPKQKRPNKARLVKAARSIFESSGTDECLSDVTIMDRSSSFSKIKKIKEPKIKDSIDKKWNDIIDSIKQYRKIKPIITNTNSNNKENVSDEVMETTEEEESNVNRKFFKSKRRTGVVFDMKAGSLKICERKMPLNESNFKNHKADFVKPIETDDFNMTAETSSIDINNILNILKDDVSEKQIVNSQKCDDVTNSNVNSVSLNVGGECNPASMQMNVDVASTRTGFNDIFSTKGLFVDFKNSTNANVSNNTFNNNETTSVGNFSNTTSTTMNSSKNTSIMGGLTNNEISLRGNNFNENKVSFKGSDFNNSKVYNPNTFSNNTSGTGFAISNSPGLNPQVMSIINDFNDDSSNSVLPSTTSSPPNTAPPTIDRDLILSPTSQMCNMASGLALNSPKKGILNINSLLDDVEKRSVAVEMESSCSGKKLFPIFSNKASPAPAKDVNNKPADGVEKGRKKWRSIPEDQYFLDAGQKKFGLTHCSECDLVYHAGDPNDEIKHQEYHDSTNVLRFPGWKNERVVGNFSDGRIIKMVPGDSKSWWKRVKELSEVMNKDLGCYDLIYPVEGYQIYLCIKNRQIAGCLVAEPQTVAYKMLESDSVDLCSEESYPVKCGIARLWVAPRFRRQCVASALVRTLMLNFMLGYKLKGTDIAMSAPNDMGKLFAKKFFGTQNYLIYLS